MSTLRPALFSLLLMAVLGAVHALSFAPQPLPAALLPFVQLISFALLVYFCLKAPTTKAAVAKAWVFGFAQFSVGLYWFYISLHYYGSLAPLLAALAVALFAAAMALYYAIAVLISRWLIPTGKLGVGAQLAAAVVWASSWTLLEWVRGTFFTGFPWLNIGYAHVDGMFAGWATVLGVYGVAWFAAFTAACLALFALNNSSTAPKTQALPLGLAVVGAGLGIVLAGIPWHSPHGDPFIVRLAQGNVDQNLKFDPRHLRQGVERYQQLAALEAKDPASKPTLILLPETVIPTFQHQWPASDWQRWIDIAIAQNATLLLGVPLYTSGQTPSYTNSIIAIDPTTTVEQIQKLTLSQRYDKHHLVPFGEFIPQGFRWFVDLLQIPLGDFNRGATRQANFSVNEQYIGPDICYEDVFGEEIIQSVRAHPELGPGATVLVNLSNLGWFGDSWALRQHLQIARMRSIESARPMLRATNTGISAAILPNGKIQAAAEPHSLSVLDVEVQATSGLSPYARWSNKPIVIISLLLLVLSAWRLRSANH